MTTSPTTKVQSPLHVYLSQLLKNIQADQATMARALRGTCEQMAGGTVWYGPAATSWTNELTGQAGALAKSIGQAVDAVETALQGTPATCTPARATLEAQLVNGWESVPRGSALFS